MHFVSWAAAYSTITQGSSLSSAISERGLPCNVWRIDNRISRTLGDKPKAKLPIGHYLRENFYITTSGNFRTQTLSEVMLEVGADRILYSVDYPFEDTGIAADWFDHCAISEADRVKIGHTNAAQLFRV